MKEPKFKVGQVLKYSFKATVMEIDNDGYHCDNAYIPFTAESMWELSEEPASEDLEEEIENYIKDSLAIKFPTTDNEQIKADIRYIARHFAEWQRKQDESRRKANIALANTDVPKDKDLEIAFEDIWSDVENYISESYNLSDEQKCKLKNAHHDTFEAGAIWQNQQMMKNALDGCVSLIVKSDTSSRNLFISTPQLYKELQKYKDGDKLKIIICKPEQQ